MVVELVGGGYRLMLIFGCLGILDAVLFGDVHADGTDQSTNFHSCHYYLTDSIKNNAHHWSLWEVLFMSHSSDSSMPSLLNADVYLM